MTKSSPSGETFRKACSGLARSLYDLCPFSHMINVVARSGDFVKLTALEVALQRSHENDTEKMAREDIVKWLLLHGSMPKLVKSKALRDEATAEWRKLWKNGAFNVEQEVQKKELQRTKIKETKRRRASMLLPSPQQISSNESSPQEAQLSRRSTSSILSDMGLNESDIVVRENEERNEKNDGNENNREKRNEEEQEEETCKTQGDDIIQEEEPGLTSLQSRGHNLPPGILVDDAMPPGLSSTLESMIKSRVQDTNTRDEMIRALRSLETKNREHVERLKRDRDEIRLQLLSITNHDRQKMLTILDESDMYDDEKDLPIWKQIVRLSSKYVRMAGNRASTTEREKREKVKSYFNTLQKKLARLEEERFRAKRVYALQVSNHLT